MKATTIALLCLTFCVTLNAQIPVEIMPSDTAATRYVDALKQALLTSPSFVLKSTGARVRVMPVVGGSVTTTCGEDHYVFRGVALLVTGMPSGKEAVFTSILTVGEETETANKSLLKLYDIATAFGIPRTR